MRPGPPGSGRLRGPRRRLGPPPPRPRRPRLHRSPGPHRARSAGLQPRRGGRGVRARTQAALRGRSDGQRTGREALTRDRQSRTAHRRGRGAGAGRPGPLGRRHSALRDRVVLGRGERGNPPALPLPRSTARPDAAGDRAPPLGGRGDARVPLRRGVSGDRDANPHEIDARGRPRLPRPEPPAARFVLRPAPVTTTLQATSHDRRLRAVFSDRALLQG